MALAARIFKKDRFVMASTMKRTSPCERVRDLLHLFHTFQLTPDQELELEYTLTGLLQKFLQPDKGHLQEWKYTPDGRRLFHHWVRQTMNGQRLNPEVEQALWLQYTGCTLVKTRTARPAEGTPRRCVCCGAKSGLEIDHKIPLACGGRDVAANVQYLCKHHNGKKNDRITHVPIVLRSANHSDPVRASPAPFQTP